MCSNLWQYVTTDCGAAKGLTRYGHGYAHDANETVAAMLNAGVDMSCGTPPGTPTILGTPGIPERIDSLRHKGEAGVAWPRVDAALSHLLTVQMRLGFFDDASTVPYARIGPDVIDAPRHRALAKEAADQSLVLLKNERADLRYPPPALPLRRDSTHVVAVIGPLADNGMNMLGNYYGTPPTLVSPLDGVRAYAGTTLHASGYDIDWAAELATRTDVDAVVLVVGLRSEAGAGRFSIELGGGAPMDEAEGLDRTSLLLPGRQQELVLRVSGAVSTAAAKRGVPAPPVVLVLISGGSVDVSLFARSNPGLPSAILWCGYPGQVGGAAIADALWGATNPSGRLTTTWHDESFARAVPKDRMAMRPLPELQHPGRTHRFFTGVPIFQFGHGLSYSRFRTTIATAAPTVAARLPSSAMAWVDSRALRSTIVVEVNVTVTHAGGPPGTEVVLLMARPPEGIAGVDGAPLQSLVAFTRVPLGISESRNVVLKLDALALSHARRDGSRTLPAGVWSLWTGVRDDDDAEGMGARSLKVWLR